jgi:ribosomal subunit interface protein
MRIEIRGQKLELSTRLREHAERRIGFALGRFAPRIARVVVRFSGAGAEKRCQIDVSLRSQSLPAEDVHSDAFAAVDNAASRVARLIARIIERERDLGELPLPSRKNDKPRR